MLPADADYDQEYTEFRPIFSYFRPPGAGVIEGAPHLAELIWPGENYSGMETTPGRQWRLIDANADALRAAIEDLLGYATYDEAVAAGGRSNFIVGGFDRNDVGCLENFNQIKQNAECANQFADLTMAAMTNVHAYVPRILDDNERDVLKCWKALRLHEVTQHPEFPGFFGVPDSLDNPNTLVSGFQCLHLGHYPGYKHASGQKNGRAIPPVVWVSLEEDGAPEWRANISCQAASWLADNYHDFAIDQLESGQQLWDYVLAISAASVVQEGMETYTGYELNIPFPQNYETFQQVSNLGEAMRLLQHPSSLPDTNDYSQLQQAVISLIQIELVNNDGDEIQIGDFHIQNMKQPTSITSRNPAREGMVEWNEQEDKFVALCQASEFNADELGEILGPPQRVCIDHTGQTQWITGVPQNVLNFTLGNRKVLQNWISLHSDLVPEESLMHATWDDAIRTPWFRELTMVIRNITILMLLRPRINDFATTVIDDLLPWVVEVQDEEEE